MTMTEVRSPERPTAVDAALTDAREAAVEALPADLAAELETVEG